MSGPLAGRHRDRLGELALDLGRRRRGVEAGPHLDAVGLAQRDHRELEDDAVGDHDPVGSRDQRRIEEPERAGDAVDLSGERAAAQLDSLADPERARAEQDERRRRGCRASAARRDRGHGRERTTDRQRARVEAGDAQRDEDHHARSSAGERGSRRRRPCPGPCGGRAPARGRGRDCARAPSRGRRARQRSRRGPACRRCRRCRGGGRRRRGPPAISSARTSAPPRALLGVAAVDLLAEPDLAPDLGPALEQRIATICTYFGVD